LSTLKKFAGQTALYGLSTIASRTLNFFLTPIYTKVYAPAVYGIFTTLYAWASILNAIMAFGMETTYFRYLNKENADKKKVYNSTFFVVASLAFLFLFTTLIFINPIAAWMQEGALSSLADYKTYIQLFAFILFFDALCVIPFAKIRAEGRPGRYSLIKLLNILSFIGLNLFFLFVIPFIIKNDYLFADFFASWYREEWVGYVFISNLISTVFTFLLLLPEIIQLRFKIDKLLLKTMFGYSFPILIANLSFIINENSDKIFLDHLLPAGVSEYQVGIYGACCKIAIFMSLFNQAFRIGAEPFFFNYSKEKDAKNVYATIMNYFVIALAFIFVGLVANIEILKYFIDDSYWSGLNVVPILLFGYMSLGIYMNLSIWYKLSDQTKYGLYISGIGAILTIVLNVIFIPIWGYLASAWISLIAYTSMMVLSYLWGKKHYPVPYQIKRNLCYVITSVILVLLSFVLFERNLIIGNILFILFGILILYLEKDNLKNLLQKNEN
jgi:O-antigen/teichoic acid export membrane protein